MRGFFFFAAVKDRLRNSAFEQQRELQLLGLMFSSPETAVCCFSSMKKGQIVSISRQLPADGPFWTYRDLQNHWNRLVRTQPPFSEVPKQQKILRFPWQHLLHDWTGSETWISSCRFPAGFIFLGFSVSVFTAIFWCCMKNGCVFRKCSSSNCLCFSMDTGSRSWGRTRWCTVASTSDRWESASSRILSDSQELSLGAIRPTETTHNFLQLRKAVK